MEPNLMGDFDRVLAADRRAANREMLTALIIAFAGGAATALALWAWTAVEWALLPPESSHWITSVGYGWIVMFVIAASQGFPQPSNYPVSDAALKELASLDIGAQERFSELKNKLQTQGYVSLKQVDAFAHEEHLDRERRSALNKPGAKALLS